MATSCIRILLFGGMFCSLAVSKHPVKAGTPPFEMPSSERYKTGKETLEKYKSRSDQSSCWKEAVSKIETSCDDLHDVEQSYLAIDFTNCHLEKSGRVTYPCKKPTMTVKECTRDMDAVAFGAYTTFFTHTSNMCFFLSSQAWQERTENTITELSGISEQVSKQLQDSSEKQRLVLKHQNTSLENQKKIIKSEMHLTETLETSAQRARTAFEDMHHSASEQKALFSETFDSIFKRVESIRQLQSMLLGEFISLQSLAFHVVAICVCYFFTSAPRTSAARLLLFVGLAVLIGVERLVTSWSIGDDETTESTEVLHGRLWFCRKVFIMSAALLLLIVGYQYQDYARVNYDVLQEIRKQVRELWSAQYIQNKTTGAITNGEEAKERYTSCINKTTGAITNGEEAKERPSVTYQHKAGMLRYGDVVDAAGSEGEDSDSSYNPNEAGSESCFTDSDEEIQPGLRERSNEDGQKGTPVLSQAGSKTPEMNAAERKHDSKVTPPISQSPFNQRYNLRPRRSTPSSPLNRSGIGNMPSPRMLSELIQNMKQSTSRQYTAVVKKGGDSSGAALFSSDEES